MVPLKKELVIFLVAFWLACFGVGYVYAPQISKIVNPEGKVEGLSTQSVGQNQTLQIVQPKESIQQIDPTDLDTLTLESFTTSLSDGNPLSISTSNNNIASCKKFGDGITSEVTNPEDYLAFVNKDHKLSYDYTPADLVYLSDNGISATSKYITLRKEPTEKLKEMFGALNSAGFKVTVSSGWRSFGYQQKVLNNWIKMVGQKNANNYSAIPGYSEHHLGTTVDIMTSDNGYSASANYFTTKTFRWLSDNAYKYGFTLSYPQGKESVTGYNAEGWHYRYVGIDMATELHNLGVTFNEYMNETYNICTL